MFDVLGTLRTSVRGQLRLLLFQILMALDVLDLLSIILQLQLLKVPLSPDGYNNHASDGQQGTHHHESEHDLIILEAARVIGQTGQRRANENP